MGEGEGGRTATERGEQEEEESFRERSSHFSLDFPTIKPAISDGARGKELPRDKSYKWRPETRSFDKLREVGVFFYLDILCLKSHENGFGCCEAGNGHGLRFQEAEPMLDEGAVLGQPTDWFGTVKNNPDLLVGSKLSM